MEYCIVNTENIIENIIVADEAFAGEIGALPGYEGAEIGAVYSPLTPAQLREQAYNTEKVIVWREESLTVTEAAQLWQYYAAEGDEKATELQKLIAEAKTEIRNKYPDAEVPE